MSLNINKCCVISFTRKRNRTIFQYNIDGFELQRTHVVRDLGVDFDESLSFRFHYDRIVEKGFRLLGFITRITKGFKKPSSLITLFKSLVRSVLEYACPIWSPFYKTHISNIERVQARCLKIATYRHNMGRIFSSYADRLTWCRLHSLETRRSRYDLIYLHKIIHHVIDSDTLLSLININTNYRSRCPQTFALRTFTDNVSHFNPVTRMCRFYNEVNSKHRHQIDIFNRKYVTFKKSIDNIFCRDIANDINGHTIII